MSRPIPALTAALLAGCPGEDGGNGAYGALPGPKVEWLSQGDGPENDAPLEPLLAGYLGLRPDSGNLLAMSAPVDAGRDDVSVLSVDSVAYGHGMGLYRHAADGVVVHALDDHLDPTTVPVLMVPDKVRVGMRWRSDYGEGTVFNEQAVVSRRQVNLPIGPVTAWGIGEYQGEQLLKVRWYAEGIGRIDAGPTTTAEPPEDAFFSEMIVPLDPQEGVELALAPATFSLLLDPFLHPLDLNSRPQAMGLGSDETTTRLTALGYLPPACTYCSASYVDFCVELDDNLRLQAADDIDCPPSAATWLPPQHGGFPADALGQSDGHGLFAWETPEGTRCLTADGAGHYAMRAHGCDGDVLRDVTEDAPLIDAWRSTRALGLAGYTFVGETLKDAPNGTVRGAAIDPEGRVFPIEIRDTTLVWSPPVALLPGKVTVGSSPGDRFAVVYTLDGRLYRVAVRGGAVEVDSLGDVEFRDETADHALAGIGVDPLDPAVAYALSLPYPLDRDGDGYWDMTPLAPPGFHRADLPRDPIPVTTPTSWRVGYGEFAGALLVCGVADGVAGADDWTVAGQPAPWVSGPTGPNDACRLILPPEDVPPLYADAPHALEGTLAGVGRVRIGFGDRPLPFHLASPVAPTPDGGGIDAEGLRIDVAGLPAGREAVGAFPASAAWAATPDHGGYGLYRWTLGSPTPVLLNLGGGIDLSPCVECTYKGGVQGGGAVLFSPSGGWIYRPGGAIDAIPSAQLSEVAVLNAVLALDNGRICGAYGSRMRCIDADGTRNELPYDLAYATFDQWPLPDGRFARLVYAEGGGIDLLAIDPDTFAAESLGARTLYAVATASDGRVYAFARTSDPFQGTNLDEIVVFDADGMRAEPLPADWTIGLADQTEILPLEDHWMFFDGNAWHRSAW